MHHEDGPLVLTVTRPESPDNRRRHIRVTRQRCLVGSSPQASVCIKESSLAARHAEIVRGPLGTYVRQLEEQIEVNGETAAEAWIDNGDQLGFGPLEMLVEELGFDASGWSIEWDTLFPSLNDVSTPPEAESSEPTSIPSTLEVTEAVAEVALEENSVADEAKAIATELNSEAPSLPFETFFREDAISETDATEDGVASHEDKLIAEVESEKAIGVDGHLLNESSFDDIAEVDEPKVLESPGTLDTPADEPESAMPTFEIPYCDLNEGEGDFDSAAPEAIRADDYPYVAEEPLEPALDAEVTAANDDGAFDPWRSESTSHVAASNSAAPSGFDVWQPETPINYDDVDNGRLDFESSPSEQSALAETAPETGEPGVDQEPASAAHFGSEVTSLEVDAPVCESETIAEAESMDEAEPVAEPQAYSGSSTFGESSNWLKELYDSIIPDDRDAQLPENAASEPEGFDSPFAIPHAANELPLETSPAASTELYDSPSDDSAPSYDQATELESEAEPAAAASGPSNSGPTITSLLRDLNDLYDVTPSDEGSPEPLSARQTASSEHGLEDDIAAEPESVATVAPEAAEIDSSTESELEAESFLDARSDVAEHSVISALANEGTATNDEADGSAESDSNSVAAILERMRQSGEISSQVEIPSDSESEPETTNNVSVDIPEFQIPEPAAPPVASQDDSGNEVDDYMSQLLTRLRGGAEAPVATKEAVDKTKPAVIAPEVKKPESDDLEPENPLSATEYLPKAVAPEKPTNLSALRQIANQSVQAAIQRSVKSKNQSNSMMYLAGSGLSFFVSAVLFIMSKAWFDVAFLCGCAAAIACGLCGFMFVSVNDAMEKIRHRKAAREQSKPEEVTENTDAPESVPVNETSAG